MDLHSIITYLNTDYGKISCNLKSIMKEKKIGIYKLSREADIKYDVIRRYRDNEVQRFDSDILAKMCFCLDCEVSSLLKYEK